MGLSDIFIYSGSVPIELILWSFYIAIVIGTIAMYLTKVKFGKLVYALLDKNACTPETALTADEAGVKLGFFIKVGLKNHLNYKDLLVAITEDGKYYANMRYTTEPPEHKILKTITRKKRSRIKEKSKQNNSDTEQDILGTQESTPAPNTAFTDTDVIPKESAAGLNDTAAGNNDDIASTDNEITDQSSALNDAEETKPERPKFNIYTARYYIPEAVHAKVMSLYNDKSLKLRWIIIGLIALGVITYFGGFIVEGLMDMIGSIGSN